jgi:hypothetical protein
MGESKGVAWVLGRVMARDKRIHKEAQGVY